MPETKEIGSLFAHTLKYPSKEFPLIDRGRTQEIEHPFRSGYSVVFRVPFTPHALVLGKWGEPAKDPDEALHAVLRLFREVR